MLSVVGNGTKLKPLVLINRKPQVKALDRFKDKLVFALDGTSWMNDSLPAKNLNSVLENSMFSRRLLVWDSFRSHISEARKTELNKLKLDTAVVPGACTKFI